ncbi:hypothetical protein CK503_01795 [Aliifodinibius salipaludis]|uniref:Uncharacterized protein n=1 Tax=Fodinibius salipaludis TaxID=2032627 RepID=A0A2A2GDU6_9BACT|nr:hypothetical protein [Aliifodinibius salipaludis]PAU95816.1 hypothetical protein CK503_01795 [Aliifodinibius salipaludis]
MFKSNKHIVKIITGLLIVAATFFCVLFGQGAHLHDLDIHISSHLDVHAHVHAHESHDEPVQANDSEGDPHRHEVSTASDIIGTLTSPYQLSPDLQPVIALSLDAGSDASNLALQRVPVLLDLPPPRPVPNQYHLSSFSRRGPPIA